MTARFDEVAPWPPEMFDRVKRLLARKRGGPMKYRKKPVVIEAMQWDGTAEGATPIIDWVLAGDGTARYDSEHREALTPYRPDDLNEKITPAHLSIDTLEGTVTASPGDWVIRGVAGEFYPCKPEIFEQTYDAVDE